MENKNPELQDEARKKKAQITQHEVDYFKTKMESPELFWKILNSWMN